MSKKENTSQKTKKTSKVSSVLPSLSSKKSASKEIHLNSNISSRKISRKETIVAVRMPKGLIEELKDLQKINHFMDLSDEIRFIVRKYCLVTKSPQESLSKTLSQSAYLEQKQKEKLIEELSSLLSTLQTGSKEKEEKIE